jgi:hypothetical protein
MTGELVEYLVLATTSAAAAVVLIEGVRRRVAGTRFDRDLREQRP